MIVMMAWLWKNVPQRGRCGHGIVEANKMGVTRLDGVDVEKRVS
jgi:hypothetical protein